MRSPDAIAHIFRYPITTAGSTRLERSPWPRLDRGASWTLECEVRGNVCLWRMAVRNPLLLYPDNPLAPPRPRPPTSPPRLSPMRGGWLPHTSWPSGLVNGNPSDRSMDSTLSRHVPEAAPHLIVLFPSCLSALLPFVCISQVSVRSL